MKLDFNSCSHNKQCVMEDEFSFWKVIGNKFRYQAHFPVLGLVLP